MKKIMTTTTTIQANGTEVLFRDFHKTESCAGMNHDIDACDNTEYT